MFRDEIKEHARWVKQTLGEHPDIANIEERTKGSLIDPLLRCLGYDPNDPGQVRREAGIRSKRVDYMLIGEKDAKIAVEAKSAKTILSDKVIDQLDDYFHHSDAVAGVLTNGIDYWLFTDLDKTNVMDSEPYHRVNIKRPKDITDNDISHFKALARSHVQQNAVRRQARRERHRKLVNEIVTTELHSPSQDFLKLVGRKAGIKPLTKAALKSLEPLVAEAIDQIRGVTSPLTPKASPPAGLEPKQPTPTPPAPPHSRFKRAHLFGEVLPAKSYPQMLLAVVAELQTRHPDEFPDRVRNAKDFKGKQWWFISRDQSDLSPKLSKAKAGDYYVNVNFSRRGLVKQAHRFLSAFGYGAEALEIQTSDG